MLGDRMRQARKHRGTSQAQLAEAMGVHPTYVSSIETGRRSPSLGNLLKLAEALDVSADYLLGRTNRMEVTR